NAKGKQNGPLLVRLVAKKSVYVLDRGGQTGDEYRASIRGGKVTTPTVDLVLEVTNTSGNNVDLWVAGSSPLFVLHFNGPKGSVVSRLITPNATDKIKKVKSVKLRPGKKHEIAITRLDSADVSRPRTATYWSEPGAHSLTVEFRTRYAITDPMGN